MKDTSFYETNGTVLLDYMGKHIVCLSSSYAPSDTADAGLRTRNEPRNFVVSTFPIVIKGMWFLLTAGHILEDIEKLLASGRQIIAARLFASFSQNSPSDDLPAAYRGIPFDLNNAGRYYVHAEGLDYGVIALRPGYIHPLMVDGVIPLTKDAWLNPPEPDTSVQHFLLGIPSQEVVTVLTNDGAMFKVRVGCPLLPVQRLSDPPAELLQEHPRFYASIPAEATLPDGNSLASINGMSGGPVFAVKQVNQKYFKYWVVAIQSSWLPSQRILAACPILPLIRAIEGRFDEASQSGGASTDTT